MLYHVIVVERGKPEPTVITVRTARLARQIAAIEEQRGNARLVSVRIEEVEERVA